jgi:hypothetical protein
MLDTRAAAQQTGQGRAVMKNEVKEDKRIRIAIFAKLPSRCNTHSTFLVIQPFFFFEAFFLI